MKKLSIALWMIVLSLFMLVTACDSKAPLQNQEVKPKQNGLEPIEIDHSVSQYLTAIMNAAQKGTVEDCPFTAKESTIKQAKAAWGEPDQVDKAGLGFYATYNQKKIVLGYNQNGEIFDVRSFADDLKKITSKAVTDSFGQPTEIREGTQEQIYVYKLQDIELKLIIPDNSDQVDHISVYDTQRAESIPATSDYFLDIKGNSNQLTAQAWETMQQWRKEIVTFAKSQDNVFINGPNQKKVALTFDDGPDEQITPAIIEILAAHHVPGNFFFIGNKVEKNPAVVKSAFDHGNLVLSHSYNHVELTKLGKAAIQTEIDKGGKAIQAVIGKEPAIIRTPYGDTNAQVAEVAKQEGYSIVLWSIDTLDWSQKDASNIVNNVINNVRNGDIILMHSDSDKTETKKALPLLIEELQKRNFDIVNLAELLNIKAYQ